MQQPSQNTVLGAVLPDMPELKVKSNPSADKVHAVVLPLGLTYEQCAAVMQAVVERHDILRMRLDIRDGEKVFSIEASQAPFVLDRIDVSRELSEQGMGAVLHKMGEIKDRFLRSFGLFSSFTFIDLGGIAKNRLLVILDHVTYDDYAVSILTEGITLGIEQVMAGRSVEWDPPSASYLEWAGRAHRYLDSEDALAHLGYWKERPWNDVYRVAVRPRAFDQEAFGRITTMDVDAKTTDAIFGWAKTARIPLWRVLLACVIASTGEVFDASRRTLAITSPVSQRASTFDDIDLSSTFAKLFCAADFVIEPGGAVALEEIVASVHRQIEGAPLNGTTYELLAMRFPGHIANVRTGVCFNYLGAVNVRPRCPHDGNDGPVYGTVFSSGPDGCTFTDGEMDWMMHWPEYRFDGLTPGALYLLRLHFFEPIADAIGQRYFDIWINGKVAVEKLDIFERAGGAYRLWIEELAAAADGDGRVTINFVSYCDSLANASINALELLEPISPDAAAAARPYDLSGYRAVRRVNAGGPAIGDFEADNFPNAECGRDTDTTPVDLNRQRDAAPPAVYTTDSYCSLVNKARHWPPISVNCQKSRSGLRFWVDSCDSVLDGGTVKEFMRVLLEKVMAVAAW